MKAVMLMFDSLNRHYLPPYGCDWVHAPKFKRLAERTATFDQSYVCSMPCMPARRELHTGRPNFLHTSWGTLEPYDDSSIERLRKAGVYTHMVTDHYHYFEDNGAGYVTKFNTWEFHRGQEGDPCWGQLAEPNVPEHINGKGRRQDWVNRQYMQREQDQPCQLTMQGGIEFIKRNADEDRWMLQIECFDPHEPFFSSRKYHDWYPEDYEGPEFDWPPYGPSENYTDEQIQHIRNRYAALLSNCDARLGDLLDTFDAHNLWDDTMLIVCTDHGHMLGEHGCFAKNWQPWYQELANTPFFVWDPRSPQAAGQRRSALVQPALDLGPTLLRFFDAQPTDRMLGKDLADVVATDATVRDAGLFGIFGAHVNVTDGHYVYMRAPERPDIGPHRFTESNIWLRNRFDTTPPDERRPFEFTLGAPIAGFDMGGTDPHRFGTLLFDIQADPGQQHPLTDPDIEARMIQHMKTLMADAEAPAELYRRLALD